MKKNMINTIVFFDITENNLKHLDFEMSANDIMVVSGVSGSGKSTLVNHVVATEALRQQQMRLESDKLINYSVRPSFKSCSLLPDPVIVSQRSAYVAGNIRFGTRTRINEALVKYFVDFGSIKQKKVFFKHSLLDIFAHQQRFYSTSRLYLRVINFAPLNKNIRQQLEQQNITSLLLRAEGKSTIKSTEIRKLPAQLEKYEGFIEINSSQIADELSQVKAIPVLMLASRRVDESTFDEYDHDEIEFDQHGFVPNEARIFRLPNQQLFSRATQSSISGYCRQCEGTGEKIDYDLDSVIITDVILSKGFLNVPKTKSGRYQGFKYLPSGLLSVLKKKGVDITLSFKELPESQRETILQTLQEKLSSNRHDTFAQSLTTKKSCLSCQGTGFGWQARAVKVGERSLHEYLAMNGKQLSDAITKFGEAHSLLMRLKNLLYYLHALAIEHISFERSLSTLSSGELQRMKLLPSLLEEVHQRLFILDEPSSNLQFKDNLSIINLLQTIKAKGNRVLLVEHNPLYQVFADKVLCIGPNAGAQGGEYCAPLTLAQQLKGLSIPTNVIPLMAHEHIELNLQPIRHIQLTHLSLPKNAINTVIGASGSGKSTLCREMIYPALKQLDYLVELLDSRPFLGASHSIVATYLDVFACLRQFFSTQSHGQYSASDFSFNAGGACEHCSGKGVVTVGNGHSPSKTTIKQPCPVCFGSRFRPEIALFYAKIGEQKLTLSEVLQSDLTWIASQDDLSQLHKAIEVLDALSLGYLQLGRETQTLSGGELQRLKIAKFLLKHQLNSKDLSKSTTEAIQQVMILDEPCRGLDSQAVDRLIIMLRKYLSDATLIVIEHNPYFIYRSDYIVDLGISGEKKREDNIYHAEMHAIQALNTEELLTRFPSLNHREVMGNVEEGVKATKYEADSITSGTLDDSMLLETLLPLTTTHKTERSKQRYQFIPALYRQQKNFEREQYFNANYHVEVPDDNCFFYRDWQTLHDAVLARKPQEIFYNPLIRQLERYSTVPLNIKKKLLSTIPDKTIFHSNDDWHCLVLADNISLAYLQGAGVVIIRDSEGRLSYHGIRLFSLKNRVVDRVFPQNFVFNLYKNSCHHCHGYGKLLSYPLHDWVDETRSVLDKGSFPFALEKSLPKSTINYFSQKEGLFDFTKPIQELSRVERNILFYGFKEYRFQKPNAKSNADHQYYEWEGLNSYIYDKRKQFSANKIFTDQVEWVDCPFCISGFSSKIQYYQCDGEIFTDSF
ncbi:GTPase EngC [Amphritea opalescens]|uniref:UvrABC system protein A n=1 Tax=Amphritea opalescens TaxID=2490544 RepID=A0A430KPE7_9GAMM|nr:GTPase EngC [Amphritea opalescens]RTE65350.1 GTPase EngC [Amphritea opalescens]